MAGPFSNLPFVHGARQGDGQVRVLGVAGGWCDRVQDAKFDVVRVEVLGAHEGEAGAGVAAFGGVCVAA